jgi:hypothetical protein
MLKHISLSYIDNVLNDADGKALVSPIAQLLYIRMIINKFRNFNELGGFIETSKVISFQKYGAEMVELQKIGLLEIKKLEDEYHYLIKPHWEKYIMPQTTDYSNVKTIQRYEIDLLASEQTIEFVAMKEQVSRENAKKLLVMFIEEQKVTDKTYQNLQDAKKHFLAWVKTNQYIFNKKQTPGNTAKGNLYTD